MLPRSDSALPHQGRRRPASPEPDTQRISDRPGTMSTHAQIGAMAGVLLTILRHIQGRPAGGGLPHLGPADPAEFGSVGAVLCSEQAS